jgi:lactate permease
VAPILGFIGVALSGSNTSTNAMFGKFQALVGQLLGFPLMLLPVMNSVGAEIGPAFIIVAPLLGFIGVALSGSNTSTNAMFGKFQALVGQLLGFPLMLLPTLNSVGAEIGKPIAPQTASVGVSTSEFVRNEGEVIRHNFGWTLVLLVYLVLIGVACYLFFPGIADLPKA